MSRVNAYSGGVLARAPPEGLRAVPNRNPSLESGVQLLDNFHVHSEVGARREGDAHCGAGESTPVDKLATRVARRARRRVSRLTPCGWRERQPSSRSAMARTKWSHKTAAEKAAALAVAVEQQDAQCAAAAARRAKRTSWAAIDLLMMG